MARDLLTILKEVRGTSAPEAPIVDGIYHDLTIKDYNGNAGVYGDIVAKYTGITTAANSVASDIVTIQASKDAATQSAIVAASSADSAIAASAAALNSKEAASISASNALASKNLVDASVSIVINAKAIVTDDLALVQSAAITTANNLIASTAVMSTTEAFKDTAVTASVTSVAIQATLDKYFIGAVNTNPTVDRAGDTLVEGAVYFNTVTNKVMYFNGISWYSPESITAGYAGDAHLDSMVATTAASTATAASLLTAENAGLARADATLTELLVDSITDDVATTTANVILTHADVITTASNTTTTAGYLSEVTELVSTIRDGRTWFFGEGDPLDSTGVDGDMAYNMLSTVTFIKVAGIWRYTTILKGAAGDMGLTPEMEFYMDGELLKYRVVNYIGTVEQVEQVEQVEWSLT